MGKDKKGYGFYMGNYLGLSFPTENLFCRIWTGVGGWFYFFYIFCIGGLNEY